MLDAIRKRFAVTFRIDRFIAGKPTGSTSGRTSPVHDPSTGEVRGEVGLATDGEVGQAVAEVSCGMVGVNDVDLAFPVSR